MMWWTCSHAENPMQNGRWTRPHARNPMQNERWTRQHVGNPRQNGRWTCPNVANPMQNGRKVNTPTCRKSHAKWKVNMPKCGQSHAKWKVNTPTCSKSHAKWKVNMPKCGKYHAKWQIQVPTVANTRQMVPAKKSKKSPKTDPKKSSNYFTPIFCVWCPGAASTTWYDSFRRACRLRGCGLSLTTECITLQGTNGPHILRFFRSPACKGSSAPWCCAWPSQSLGSRGRGSCQVG